MPPDKENKGLFKKLKNEVKNVLSIFSTPYDEKLGEKYKTLTGDLMFHEINNEMVESNFRTFTDALVYMNSISMWFSHQYDYNYSKQVKNRF